MLGAAGTALFIHTSPLPAWQGFTPLHLLIPLTVLGLARALWHLRQGHINAHRSAMLKVYLGAGMLAGLFTLLPNRTIGRWLWSALGMV